MSYEYFLEIYWPSVDASGWPSVRFSTNFQSLCKSSGITHAEEVVVSTITNIISSQILNYWNLSKEINVSEQIEDDLFTLIAEYGFDLKHLKVALDSIK